MSRLIASFVRAAAANPIQKRGDFGDGVDGNRHVG
jgi:hypothetical protein